MSLLGTGLDTFLSVVETGTVQHAARKIGLTQTGVTQRIRALEGQLGAALFTRSRRGMRLTPEGEALLHYCQAAQDLAGETMAKIQRSGALSPVHVSICGPTSMIRSRVIPQCAKVRPAFPNLLFHFDFSDDGSGGEKLRGGAAHLAILPREEVAPEMDSKLLSPQRYLLVGPRAWSRRKLKEILARERIVDFEASDRMTFRYLESCHLLAAAKPERHFASNTDALVELIGLGFGYTVLPDTFAEPLIRARKIANLNPHHVFAHSMALAWYPRHPMPAYFSGLVRAIR